MHFLLNSKGKDIPMGRVDWIVLSANAVGIAIVALATLHANPPATDLAEVSKPVAAIEVASLD